MILRDYHMHTVRCDGKHTAEEMVLAAIDRGMEEIGISGHSHTSFDESYCMSREATREYLRELTALREKYRDRIPIRIGLEMDRYSDETAEGFDYLIGSVHYIRLPLGRGPDQVRPGAVPKGCLLSASSQEVYVPVDESPGILKAAADTYFGGDMISLAERYFETVGTVAEATGCDIIGHFDLITKFNEPGPGQDPVNGKSVPALFDEGDPRYIRAWKSAVDRLLPYDIPFEINTGAMSKGYRTGPYPAGPIRDYIRAHGGRFILSSDSHRTDTLCYAFERYESELWISDPMTAPRPDGKL